MSRPDPSPVGETGSTDITIRPDGRIYIKGLSRPVLDILASIQPSDEALRQLVFRVRECEKISISPVTPLHQGDIHITEAPRTGLAGSDSGM